MSASREKGLGCQERVGDGGDTETRGDPQKKKSHTDPERHKQRDAKRSIETKGVAN